MKPCLSWCWYFRFSKVHFSGITCTPEIGDRPFGSPPNPSSPDWCICSRCWPMLNARQNVCCRDVPFKTTRGEFRAVLLDYNVLRVSVRYSRYSGTCPQLVFIFHCITRYRADWFAAPLDYSHSGIRNAAYRQYILSFYGYLGQGNRRIAPSCVVTCVRKWYPSPDDAYMVYLSQ